MYWKGALASIRILGFLYDFETQLSLVLVHAEHAEFQFFGPKRFDRAAILSRFLATQLALALKAPVTVYCGRRVVRFSETLVKARPP